MPKPPSQTAAGRQGASPEQAKHVADVMAERPYGGVKEVAQKAENISISLPPSMVEKLQDTARANKRGGDGLKSVSAIVRNALEKEGY
jgi:alpha-amylase/alpha-mannosidase (GH57 family)